MDDNVQNTEMQDAIPAEQETHEETSAEDTAATVPDGQSGTEDATAQDTDGNVAQPPESEEGAENETPAPFLSVPYNHEDQALTREEAVDWVQRGMHYDALHKKLDYAAALSGTDVNSLIDGLIKAPEEAHRKHLVELYGEDATEDIEIGMEIFRKKQGETYDKIVADRKAATQQQAAEKEKGVQSRLADEYIELKREIPDAPDYAQLPDSVIKEAANGKRDLLSCYLRYLHGENQKITAANATAQEAAKASTGEMKSDPVNNTASDEFIRALWSR